MKVTAVQIRNWKSFEDSGLVTLDQINVLLGRNNSGKSALLRAVHLMQRPFQAEDVDDIRLGASQATIHVRLGGSNLADDVSRHFSHRDDAVHPPVVLDIQAMRQDDGRLGYGYELKLPGGTRSVTNIRPEEPRNFIYTYLSKRKVSAFQRQVDRNSTPRCFRQSPSSRFEG